MTTHVEESDNKLRELFRLLSGVRYLKIQRHVDHVMVNGFSCKSFDTLKIINEATDGSNAPFRISNTMFQAPDEDNDDMLFHISFEDDRCKPEQCRHRHSEIFGIHLTWEMRRKGLIEREASRPYLEFWRGKF